MTSASYSYLFTVEILHKFFTNQACTDFIIVPSVETARILKGNKIIVKQYANKLYAGVQVNEPKPPNGPGKPLIVPKEGMQLTFFLQLNNPLFFNYTNLPLSYPPGKVYYFTNRNNNTGNGKSFISSGLLPYDSSKAYNIGDVVTDTAGIVFKAIRSSSSANPAALTDTSYWEQVDNNRYMNEGDSLQWLQPFSTYKFATPQSSATIMVLGYNTATNDYTILVLSDTIYFRDPVSAFELDLSTLPAGKYILNVNGEVKHIYLNNELNRTKVFGVIEIYNEATLPAAYQLLDNNNNLSSPVFSIHFLNRSTIWKYVLASGPGAGDITDNNSFYQFGVTNPVSNALISTAPIPLNEKALDITLTIDSQDYTPIACASPQRLTNITIEDEAYYCSEIFLNY